MKQPELSKGELEGLHSVLRRAAERAEQNNEAELARKLAEELAVLDHEIWMAS